MNLAAEEKVKYSESRVISEHELVSRPGFPSQIMREIEADIIGRLARSVALSGRRFENWPDVKLTNDPVDRLTLMSSWRVVATVTVR